MLSLSISVSAQLNLERVGVYGGTSITIQKYNVEKVGRGRDSGVLALSNRVGGFLSYYGDRRFSYETGLFVDMVDIPHDGRFHFKYDDGLSFDLQRHEYTNIGIPIAAVMRTNVTRSCVTYFKFALNNIFTVQDRQTLLYTGSSEQSPGLAGTESIDSGGFRYFGSDVDFGFGTFWYLKKFGARLCLEPKITVLQYRNNMRVNSSPDKRILNSQFNVFSRMGFEVSLYKNLF